jgi:ornithine carbamoyltransferase
MKRDFLTLNDLSRAEIQVLLDRAAQLKADRAAGRRGGSLAYRTLGMIFDKPSTRTRVSFEVGMFEMGGSGLFLSRSDTQFSRNEPVSHSARVLSRYLDALVIRTFSQDDVEELARHADIPVINGLTDLYHPCQVLSDMFTIRERKPDLQRLKIAWIGDGHNMAHSWINAAGIMGFDLVLAVPEGYGPDPDILARASAKAQGSIRLVQDPVEAAAGADVLNTDVWTSMDQEDEAETRRRVFRPYQLNAGLAAQAKKDVLVLHCLPAHVGEEITEEVLEGPGSVVFDQAENRMHVQKALLEALILRKLT